MGMDVARSGFGSVARVDKIPAGQVPPSSFRSPRKHLKSSSKRFAVWSTVNIRGMSLYSINTSIQKAVRDFLGETLFLLVVNDAPEELPSLSV